jgi:transcriptional regulator with XRE-family HTH domain
MGPSAQELLVVRKRILGILLRDAREVAGLSAADCADLLGISEDEYKQYEAGQQTPTLPRLELLAYAFNVPIRHFWGSDTLAEAKRERSLKERVPELVMLREKVIGVRLRQARENLGLSQAEVAEKSGLSSGQIEVVERGMLPLPITALERAARAVQLSLDDLVDDHGTVGNWLQAQNQFEAFTALPAELRAFVVQPINRSYLELAIRLSNMHVNELRTIAESILEITF